MPGRQSRRPAAQITLSGSDGGLIERWLEMVARVEAEGCNPPIFTAKCCKSFWVWQKVNRKLIAIPSGYELSGIQELARDS
jgi:hypothetical protein